MIVLDASALVEWLLRTASGRRVEARLLDNATTLHAPHVVDLEIAQALRRLVAANQIDAELADYALADFSHVALRRYRHDLFLPRIWELRPTLTAYDAAYVALAEALGAPIITCDRRAASSRGHHARFELIDRAG